jgi:hypothetical protein
MNKQKKQLFFWINWIILILFSCFIYSVFASTDQWIVSVEITWFGIRHGTPANVDLWTITGSLNNQEFSWQFNDYFWVEDIQWDITGHYTTVQCDGVYGPSNNKLTWVYLMAWNNNPTLIEWNINNHVLINSTLNTYASILAPVTYIYKETHNDNAWLANKYWDKPRLKILIPGWTPPGSYSGTIVFSFYSY